MKTDSLIYRLLQDWPKLVLEFAELETVHAAGYTLQAIEVKQTAFRLDGVLMPPENQPQLPLVFVEAQLQPDPNFYARWFAEIFLYLYRHPPNRKWKAVVIFLNQATEGIVDTSYEPLMNSCLIKKIYLQEALQQPLSSSLPGLQVLGLLLAKPNEVVAKAKELLTEITEEWGIDKANFFNWIETLLVYKLPQLSREEIRTMLDILNVELKQTRFYQEVFAEGLLQGQEEGLQKGLEKGIEKGIKKGIEKGIEKGIKDGQQQERLRIAKSFLDIITNDQLLATKTGLSIAEVRKLRKQQ